jgi:non-specific serine/threonine protein kinase
MDATERARVRARAMQQADGVSELRISELLSQLRIEGKVRDADSGSSYRVLVKADGDFADAECGCSARPPCAHAIALARHYAEHAERAELKHPSSRWRSLIDRLTPFRVFRTPPVDEDIFVHWIELIRLDGGAWTLSLRWRQHRAKANSIGRGRLIAPGTIAASPPASMSVADQKVISLTGLSGEKPEKSEKAESATRKGAVAIGVHDIDAVLRLLSRAPYVYWEGGGGRVAFDPVPAIPLVEASDDGEGLRLKGQWNLAEGGRWHPAAPRIFAGPWPWVEDQGVLRPVFGVADGNALTELMERGAWVGPSEVGSFLASGVSAITGWGARVKIDVGDHREMVADAKPLPRLYLAEVRSGLEGNLRFAYGDFEIPSENPDPVLMVTRGGGEVCIQRDFDEEFAALSELMELGFRPEEPGYYSISGDAALDFVVVELPELSKRWEVFGRDNLKRHRVDTRALSIRARIGAKIDWLDLYVEGELEGDPVEIERILRALRRGSRYVRLGDGSHAVLPDEWSGRLRELVDELGLKGEHVKLPLYRASALEELAQTVGDVSYEDKSGWDKLNDRLNQRDFGELVTPPEGLKCEMRPYQQRGLTWLKFIADSGLGGVLADEMGLGKTVQALAMLLLEKEQGGRGPTLVVAPTSVVPNWEAEVNLHAPGLTKLRYHGAQRERFHDEFVKHDMVITSYAVLRRDIEVLSAVEWNYVILDEAQAIKNAATQTAKATRKLNARRRLGLTGTLLENHLGELWSHFQFIMPGFLGTQKQFVDTFQRPIAAGDEEAAERLRRRIRPFVLRRMKAEVAPELPPKIENTLLCELGPEQMELYRSVLDAGRSKVFDAIDKNGVVSARTCVLEVLLRLRQVCCHPALLPDDLGKGIPSAKFDQFTQFVAEVIEGGARVLVYSQFVQMLTIIRQWFEKSGIPHLYMDGRTKDREGRVRRFQEDDSIRAFLVSLRAGGTGINLTGADYVVLFDPWWNPAVEAQATDRAHRIGRKSAVFCYKMVARSTVEEKIQQLQGEKRAVTDDFIRSEAKWGINFDEAAITDLFTL